MFSARRANNPAAIHSAPPASTATRFASDQVIMRSSTSIDDPSRNEAFRSPRRRDKLHLGLECMAAVGRHRHSLNQTVQHFHSPTLLRARLNLRPAKSAVLIDKNKCAPV